MYSSEFQAVIMAAGKGSRMTELTARKTKCLLPIGNLPMIWYPIHLLEKSLFQEVIIVVLDPVKNEVQAALDKCGFKIHIDLVGIPGGDDWGTADTLRHLQDTNRIKSHIVVVSCDLITNVSLAPLLDLYRKHDAALAALFVDNKNPVTATSLPTPGPKTKEKAERDFVGINGNTSRLVFIASSSDYEETLPMSRKLLQRYGMVTLHTKLLDAHVYILNKWLCQYLSHNRSISTLKGELLPHVVRKHLTDMTKQKLDQDKTSIIDVDTKPGSDITQHAMENDLAYKKIRMLSTYTDNRCHPVYNNDLIRCYGHLVTNSESYAVRANTLQQYCRVNREILGKWSELTDGKKMVNISPSAVVKSTQLDNETCLVGEKTQVAEKTSVKNSLIGPNVEIKPKTRILNSLIMYGVSIGEGCSIQNCVICEESVIEDGCDLKDCLVGSHHTVFSGEKHSNEVLTDVDRLMEI